jgi:hypothetical protein
MSKIYEMLIRVPVTKLATIIEVLDGEGELKGSFLVNLEMAKRLAL